MPSAASEFAHPDIIIGLTVLAYRYEGLRRVDFEQDVINLLRADFEKEVGPFPLRKSSRLYESWVQQAGGIIKGSKTAAVANENAGDNGGAPSGTTASDMDDDRVVVPLWLLKQSNDEQMAKLYELLRKLPACIHWLLEQVVFPSFMQHQKLKAVDASAKNAAARHAPRRPSSCQRQTHPAPTAIRMEVVRSVVMSTWPTATRSTTQKKMVNI